jgi:hypothetical protein
MEYWTHLDVRKRVLAMKRLLVVLTAIGWVALCCMYLAAVFEAIGGSPDLVNRLRHVMLLVFLLDVLLTVMSVIWMVRDNVSPGPIAKESKGKTAGAHSDARPGDKRD